VTRLHVGRDGTQLLRDSWNKSNADLFEGSESLPRAQRRDSLALAGRLPPTLRYRVPSTWTTTAGFGDVYRRRIAAPSPPVASRIRALTPLFRTRSESTARSTHPALGRGARVLREGVAAGLSLRQQSVGANYRQAARSGGAAAGPRGHAPIPIF